MGRSIHYLNHNKPLTNDCLGSLKKMLLARVFDLTVLQAVVKHSSHWSDNGASVSTTVSSNENER